MKIREIILLLSILIVIPMRFFSQDRLSIDSLQDILTSTEDKDMEMNILFHLSNAYLSINIDTATHYAEELFTLSESLGSEADIIKSKYLLGYIKYTIQDYEKSEALFTECLTYYIDNKDIAGQIKVSDKLGVINFKKSNYTKAYDFLQKVLDLGEQINDITVQANSYNNLASVHLRENNNADAILYFNKALVLYKKNDNKIGEGSVLNNIGNIYKKNNNLDSAILFFNQALDIFNILAYKDGIATCRFNKGETYLLKDEITKSEEELQAAKDIFVETNNLYGLAATYCEFGKLFYRAKKYDKAIVFLGKGEHYAKSVDAIDYMKDIYMHFSKTYKIKRNYKKALEYYENYSVLKDSIFNVENTDIINQLKFNYETEKKDNQIRLLNSKRKSSRKIIFILLLGVGFLIMFIVIIFVQWIKRNKAYKILVEKNIKIVKTEKDNITLPISGKRDKKEEINLMSDEYKKELDKALMVLMTERKMYLKKNLSIKEVAKIIDTNQKYISLVVNTLYNQNFTSFINFFRIKEAVRLLSDKKYDSYTMEGIASEVGFNSKNTFNIAFKKVTGVTPSFFKKNRQI